MSPGPAKKSEVLASGPAAGAGAPLSRRRRAATILLAVVAVLVVAAVAFVSSGASSSSVTGASASGVSGQAPARNSSAASGGVQAATTLQAPPGMRQIALSALPAEAQAVVAKIDHGGAFHYRQDGVAFANRERRLPAEPRGYYREYTVATPGQADRGPRRIVAGRGGELYYTGDHYRTFSWVVRNGAVS